MLCEPCCEQQHIQAHAENGAGGRPHLEASCGVAPAGLARDKRLGRALRETAHCNLTLSMKLADSLTWGLLRFACKLEQETGRRCACQRVPSTLSVELGGGQSWGQGAVCQIAAACQPAAGGWEVAPAGAAQPVPQIACYAWARWTVSPLSAEQDDVGSVSGCCIDVGISRPAQPLKVKAREIGGVAALCGAHLRSP